jgi:hypothetical protein
LNLASALIKQIIIQDDIETWSALKENYLSGDLQGIFRVLNNHVELYKKLPTFEELHFEVRDEATLDKIYAIESVETDIDAWMLLDYLKNEYTQTEIFKELEQFIDTSIGFQTAEENINTLSDIVLNVSDRVDLVPPEESMQRMNIFESDEELSRYLPLGLNAEYDADFAFSPNDLVLVGGRRGAGKSLTCCNVAVNAYNQNKSSIYFTIEMDSRAILQRMCSIATGIPMKRLRTKEMAPLEWHELAKWWAGRYENGLEILAKYSNIKEEFNDFHRDLTREPLHKERQLDIVYDPGLTLGRIQAELKQKVEVIKPGVIIVDYLNQVTRNNRPSRSGQYDWIEQVEISKTLKSYAQEYGAMVFSPYQTDSTGEARFAKGILDAADTAYSLNVWEQEDNCMTFNCVKMRSREMKSFTSAVNWETLRIGPESAMNPEEKSALKEQMFEGEGAQEEIR